MASCPKHHRYPLSSLKNLVRTQRMRTTDGSPIKRRNWISYFCSVNPNNNPETAHACVVVFFILGKCLWAYEAEFTQHITSSVSQLQAKQQQTEKWRFQKKEKGFGPSTATSILERRFLPICRGNKDSVVTRLWILFKNKVLVASRIFFLE